MGHTKITNTRVYFGCLDVIPNILYLKSKQVKTLLIVTSTYKGKKNPMKTKCSTKVQSFKRLTNPLNRLGNPQ
jgi:hypothetical protein